MGLFGTSGRTLRAIVAFVVLMVCLATLAFMAAGRRFGNSLYMVLLTVNSVGYGEVRPIDTPYLHAVIVGTTVVACTGMIVLTGALVEFVTINQLQNIFF